MAQDVRQWLDEIKRLQQQLTEVSRDRDEAGESAAQWRQLYNTEAEQRRNDAKLTQQSIAALEAQIEELQSFSPIAPEGEDAGIARQQEVAQLQTVGELKAKLAEVLEERDRAIEQIKQLSQALKQEEARHADTSRNLTTALGDAVDLLAKAQTVPTTKMETPAYSLEIVPTRTANPGETAIEIRQNPAPTNRNSAQLPPSKNQLIDLPPFGN
ncbi:hypothetical protein IQ269_06285 [Tychonema sp. LEGE 07199]|uniref:hypothetical protein n=1 Tax=unclassified Tychonema TaxID=2642144 RepID=UPI0018818B85|nr:MULTISPECIES: hypothetical protein [unclassified Tychonema]MBE9120427.1 hypothetical protein [Tychonema sp. LEGE 07199]MBE9131720.1 hypothetical protein [Tychonema sp. LEGE 07196]